MYSVSYTQRSQYKCNITEKEVYLGFRGYTPPKRARGQQTGENLTGPSGTESIMGLHRG